MYLSEMQPGPKTVPPRNVSSKELDLLSQIVEKRLGMDLNRRRQERLLQMLEKRVKESGRKDLMDYLNFVDFLPDHPEWRYLEEILTIQKTEFFRESSQMTYLQEEILPEIKAKKSSQNQRKIRIWSCGCSTGEEAYSLSILIHEIFQPLSEWDIKILASDVHRQALETARKGLYPEDSLKTVKDDWMKRYFQENHSDSENVYFVADILKQIIHFRPINLMDKRYPVKTLFDIILCRNLLIYMTALSQEQIIGRFRSLLEPGGYLLLGHSEYLPDRRDFQRNKFNVFQTPLN